MVFVLFGVDTARLWQMLVEQMSSLSSSSSSPFWSRRLAPLLQSLLSWILLEHVQHADYYLIIAIICLTILAFCQVRAFTRPPPVPLKVLPQRPVLSLLFKPDDNIVAPSGFKMANVATTTEAANKQHNAWRDVLASSLHSVTDGVRGRTISKLFRRHRSSHLSSSSPNHSSQRGGGGGVDKMAGNQTPDSNSLAPEVPPRVEDVYDDDDDDERPAPPTASNDTDNIPFFTNMDLPDSFAPLLSSSQLEILKHQLTMDLLHAVSAKASIRLRPGRFEIPLDKDNTRPQFILDVPASGCRFVANIAIGSDGFSTAQDLNTKTRTTSRSKPMVKHASITIHPPMPLLNVAPTLIHFPTLFQDNVVHTTLRRIQIIRYIIDFIISISSFIEKCLWLIEAQCQIHLSKVRLTPLYKGSNNNNSNSSSSNALPDWRLSLAFSGHVLLFGIIPIPFISVVLPTFIIPQPHALLENLATNQPLASAKIRRELIAEERIALAALTPVEKWDADVTIVATPPAVGIDITLPGGVACAMEIGLGVDVHAGKYSRGGGGGCGIGDFGLPETVTSPNMAGAGQHRHHSKQTFSNISNDNRGGGGGGAGNDNMSLHSMSSWTTKNDVPSTSITGGGGLPRQHSHRSKRGTGSLQPGAGAAAGVAAATPFDANTLVPWLVELKAKGSMSHEKMTFHVLKFSALHEQEQVISPNGGTVGFNSSGGETTSKFGTAGSFAIWKVKPESSVISSANSVVSASVHSAAGTAGGGNGNGPPPAVSPSVSGETTIPAGLLPPKRSGYGSSSYHPALDSGDISPSCAAILLFPDETTSFHRDMQLLQYDYAFDVFQDTRVDAVTVSVGATHPMLNGGTMVTTILDSIFAYGTITARDDAILDPLERRRKRNILRHLPAVDFTCGVQNVYIPPESNSYSDDGQTLFLPELDGGRIMLRFLGGMMMDPNNNFNNSNDNTNAQYYYNNNGAGGAPSNMSSSSSQQYVSEGIKLLADFEITTLFLKTEGAVKEFPELDITEGVKLRTNLSGIIAGSVRAHLRPQKLVTPVSSKITGPNLLNPLEAYEIDFSRSNLSVKMKECSTALGHRRIIFPTESTFVVSVIESVVDMGFEGKTQCELVWDFQGLSPILQVTPLGQSPVDAVPESKEQASLLIAPLRQGRISFHVSPVGGIQVQKAATSREDREGLYDWKFFNALVSPDDSSAQRIIDVLQDKRTMEKLLQVTKLVNDDLYKIVKFALNQVWRAKDIFEAEGIKEPHDVIPMYKMSRLIALFLTDDADNVDRVLPIVRRVIMGDGLDVVKVKELIREHLPDVYEEWAPEIDRVVRWGEMLLGAMAVPPTFVEENVRPLAQLPHHAAKFQDIPSAAELYDTLLEKPHLPLDPVFSNLVSRVAPYLSFQQVGFLLEARSPSDWQQADLRRLRYVYSVKRKVLDIAESYGGLSFLPQSFLVSVFLGEATRASHRASKSRSRHRRKSRRDTQSTVTTQASAMEMTTPVFSQLRSRRHHHHHHTGSLRQVAEMGEHVRHHPMQPLGANGSDLTGSGSVSPDKMVIEVSKAGLAAIEPYELGDSLLGPQDVAILLQSGLTSVMKSSTVVQLNQRMLLDLICSQPRSFAVAVLAELGNPSGQGSVRSLTSALMALLELDQTAFRSDHQIDMNALLESWLPGLKIPRRGDHLAGGRWARQSYYQAIYSVADSILDDAEAYQALKGHVQRVYRHKETDPIPSPKFEPEERNADAFDDDSDGGHHRTTRFFQKVEAAKSSIAAADKAGHSIIQLLVEDEEAAKASGDYQKTIELYRNAFAACAKVLALDKHAFHATWYREFYRRNFDALMILSIYSNLIDDVDDVRHWLQALRNGAMQKDAEVLQKQQQLENKYMENDLLEITRSSEWEDLDSPVVDGDNLFMEPEKSTEQVLIDAIIDTTIYEAADRKRLREDPLVRLLISNPPGEYDFIIVSAMGVITEGKRGLELKDAFERLEALRGVKAIRADTGTARSFEYNASKIEEAVAIAVQLKKPYGLLGYSQGCANALWAETSLLSGSPRQQQALSSQNGGLVCRMLLFSAANGSFHGPSAEKKMQRFIIMCEEFFKYQQGYVSQALSTFVLETINQVLDSSGFHKVMGGANSFLPDGCRAFWREAQHLAHVPTCTLRGVMEDHTTPESLEMISHLLTKQSGSPLHDSQVHAFDAVGYPVYHLNRNGRILKKCYVGEGAIQRTHHWSPLSDEVEFVRTPKDIEMGSFECAKDRHIFPWVDVNARFGFIKYVPQKANAEDGARSTAKKDMHHPNKLVANAGSRKQSG